MAEISAVYLPNGSASFTPTNKELARLIRYTEITGSDGAVATASACECAELVRWCPSESASSSSYAGAWLPLPPHACALAHAFVRSLAPGA